jgi:hypothetical protein
MTDELDKILRKHKQALYNVWLAESKAERPQSIESTIITAKETDDYHKQAIQALIDQAYLKGYNDNSRDCYCSGDLIPHRHLKPDIISLDVSQNSDSDTPNQYSIISDTDLDKQLHDILLHANTERDNNFICKYKIKALLAKECNNARIDELEQLLKIQKRAGYDKWFKDPIPKRLKALQEKNNG